MAADDAGVATQAFPAVALISGECIIHRILDNPRRDDLIENFTKVAVASPEIDRTPVRTPAPTMAVDELPDALSVPVRTLALAKDAVAKPTMDIVPAAVEAPASDIDAEPAALRDAATIAMPANDTAAEPAADKVPATALETLNPVTPAAQAF